MRDKIVSKTSFDWGKKLKQETKIKEKVKMIKKLYVKL